MFIAIGNDISAILKAADLCSLVVEDSRKFVHEKLDLTDLPGWMRQPCTELDLNQPEFVLRLNDVAAATCSRTPHEVGVVLFNGCYYAVWDDQKDGFGLLAYIGRHGERLKTFYATEALANLAPRFGVTRMTAKANPDESLTLEYSDMAQKTIKVKVSKKGDVTIKTEGFEGTACQDATKQLEAAMGTVVEDVATQEMYAPPEQTTSIGG